MIIIIIKAAFEGMNKKGKGGMVVYIPPRQRREGK